LKGARLWLWLALLLAVSVILGACRPRPAAPPIPTPTPVAPAPVAPTPTPRAAWKEPIKVGVTYDSTGPTQIIGIAFKAGLEDAIALINRKGGVDGHPIEPIFCEHAYEVPKGVECYERLKAQGVVGMLVYGTPHVYALIDRCNADKLPCFFPGFGPGAAADGEKVPYGFPMAASYWSQGAAAVAFVLDRWRAEGRPGKPKIAYLYYDNPAGREPIDVLREIARREGLEIREYAVPAPGLEMSAQVTDIVLRYKADWVITHLFGRSPAVSIKAFREAGYPLDRVVSFIWGAGDADVEAAGGWAVAEGYYGMQISAIGTDLPVIQEIREMHRAAGKTSPPEMEKSNVYYMRGVVLAHIWAEGLRQALKLEGWPVTGERFQRGLRAIKGDIGGVLTLDMSPRDHEGGGYVRVYQVKGGRWVLAKDWFRGYREVVESFVYR
jgi:branched-chain amino acid transport system substrate-binding protein